MKSILTIAFSTLYFMVCAQGTDKKNVSIEKSVNGIQTGLVGFWGYNELRVTRIMALRSEFGIEGGIFGSSYSGSVGFVLNPVVVIEPRMYYNLNKRSAASKNTTKNSGNFVSIKTSYHPGWFTISNQNNLVSQNDISIVPTWGVRRQIGNHIDFEAGFGAGYRAFLKKDVGLLNNPNNVAVNLHLRIGYTF